MLNQEFVSAKINAKRIMCLHRTVLSDEECAKNTPWDFYKLLNRSMGREELPLLQENAPMDTPHRHIATALSDMRQLVNDIEALSLTKEQTAIMNDTELMRQNLLSVVRDVRNFVVCKCRSLWYRIPVSCGCKSRPFLSFASALISQAAFDTILVVRTYSPRRLSST